MSRGIITHASIAVAMLELNWVDVLSAGLPPL